MIKILNNKALRLIFLILGILVLINGIIAAKNVGFSLGVILTFILSATLLFSAVPIKRNLLQIIKLVLLAVFILLLSYSIFVYAYGSNDNVTFEEEGVIVLGTTVIGNQPSEDLKSRLDAALKYHQNNPNAIILVSGGQGNDEKLSEAKVMKTYLVNAGIPEDLVVMEDKSTSTVENFQYSAEIMHMELGEFKNITYITNDFHIFRAGLLAENSEFKGATHYHGKTTWYMILPNGLRESVVTIKMWLFD